jgi:hypothetical protein
MGLIRSVPIAILALAVLAAPARAGTVDTPACKRDLTVASAGVMATTARLKGVAKAPSEEKCAAYRQQFLLVVRARAVFANCKTGADREAEVGRLDGTIEDINGAIAASCSLE